RGGIFVPTERDCPLPRAEKKADQTFAWSAPMDLEGEGGTPRPTSLNYAVLAAAAPGIRRPRSRNPRLFQTTQGSLWLFPAAGAASHPELRLRISAGHVDHGLRAESRAEAAQVCAVAARLGVRCDVAQVAPLGRAVARRGLEGAAREARYRALADLAERAGAGL